MDKIQLLNNIREIELLLKPLNSKEKFLINNLRERIK